MAEASPRFACNPKGSRTVGMSREARVYTRTSKYGDDPAYGCLYRRGVAVNLGANDRFSDFGSIFELRFAGPYLAYGFFTATSSKDGVNGFKVVSLSTGRQRRYLSRGTPFETFPRPGDDDELHDLTVTPRGSVAWIDEVRPFMPCPPPAPPGSGCRGPATFEVRAAPVGMGPRSLRYGGYRVLDSGPAIAKTSLHRRGRSIYWFHDGQRRQASLR
jgi:hypothetical protein